MNKKFAKSIATYSVYHTNMDSQDVEQTVMCYLKLNYHTNKHRQIDHTMRFSLVTLTDIVRQRRKTVN